MVALTPQAARQVALALMRDHRIAVACREVEDSGTLQYLQAIERAAECSVAIDHVIRAPLPELMLAGLLVLVRVHGNSLGSEELAQLSPLFNASMPIGVRAFVKHIEVHLQLRRLRSRDDLGILDTLNAGLEDSEWEDVDKEIRDYFRCLAARLRGRSWQKVGHFERAAWELAHGLELARRHGFTAAPACSHELATLKWMTGLTREALKLHKDEALRVRAAETDQVKQLTSSYTSAAKCAIDLASYDEAAEELAKAEALFLEHPDDPRLRIVRGYWILYSGELLACNGDVERGITLIQEAQAWFEQMHPVPIAPALDAKVSLAEIALQSGNHRTTFAIIDALLTDLDDDSCLDARSRLFFLKSYLFLTDDPPTREAFDDLVVRAHLINNPAVMLMTLSNLLMHAVEFFEEDSQRFLHERILNLEPLLERSCFEDLYQAYVTARYADAIERRLRRRPDGSDPFSSDSE